MFKRGERPDSIERVRIEDTPIEAYRRANWDPYSQLAEGLQAASLEASANGQHLWDSTERLQAYSVGTWMGACRRALGNTLLATAERDTPQRGIPVDVAAIVLLQYQEAERWLAFREDVNLDPSYEQTGDIDARVMWPSPDMNTRISPEFMAGLKAGFDELAFVEHPIITSLVIDGPFMKHSFKYYKQRLAQEGSRIDARIAQLNEQWDAQLDPNVEPGKRMYGNVVELTEDILMHGVHELMPITQDTRYLAAVRRNRPQPVDTEPKIPFDPSLLGLERRRQTPSGKPFAPDSLLPGQPERTERPTKPFDVASFLGGVAAVAANRPDKPFNPGAFRAEPEEKAERPDRPFNPRTFLRGKNSQDGPDA